MRETHKNIAMNDIHPLDLPGYDEWRAFLRRKEEKSGIDYYEEAKAACRQQNIHELNTGRRRGISPVCYGAIFNKTWARFGSEWLMEKKEDGEKPKKRIKPSPRVEVKHQKQPAELVRFEGGLAGETFVTIDISPTEWEVLCRQRPAKLVFPLESVQREHRDVTNFYAVVRGHDDEHNALDGLVEELAGMDEKVIGSGAGIGLLIKEKLNMLNNTKNS